MTIDLAALDPELAAVEARCMKDFPTTIAAAGLRARRSEAKIVATQGDRTRW